MNESLVKYLAGLLDADGSLSFTFKRDQNRVGRCFVGLSLRLASSVAVDRHGFVDSLPKITGMGTIAYYGDKEQFKVWIVHKRADLEMLLPRLVKHMVIKARHWQWLLEMWRTVREDNKTCSDDERETLTAASKESRRLKHGPLKPKQHATWAWVAGYIDGDGCYSHRCHVYNGYHQWTMRVDVVAHVNDIVGLELMQSCFGGRIETMSQNVVRWVRSLGYQNRSFAMSFLPKIAQHSRLKRHKIDAMIHHHRQRLSVPGVKAQAIV